MTDPPEQRGTQDEKELKEKRDNVIQGLYKMHYETAKDRNPDRVPGTCEWFVSHGQFKQWRDSTTSCFLLVSADPGSGKSVLAKYLIDEVLPDKTSTVCYFFFKDDFPDQKSAGNALRCILHQLFSRRPDLLTKDIITLFKNETGVKQGSIADLWKKLVSALSPQDNTRDGNLRQGDKIHTHDILCIIDAFDECSDGMSELANHLCKFYSAVLSHDQRTNFNLKFLITSRPYEQIRRQFQPILKRNLAVFYLDGDGDYEKEKIQAEIDIFIEFKVNQISDLFLFSPRQNCKLLVKFREVPSRTYLWVYLTLDWVKTELDKDDEKDISTITSSLPPTVEGAYELLLSRSRKPEKTRKVLHIILAATIPLSLEEMYIALFIKPHHTDYDKLGTAKESADIIPQMDDERFRRKLRDMCGLFVTIIGSKVYLLHQTAREFLIANGSTPSENNNKILGDNDEEVRLHLTRCGAWKSTFDLRESNQILLDICITYLRLGVNRDRVLHSQSNVDVHRHSKAVRAYQKREGRPYCPIPEYLTLLEELDCLQKSIIAEDRFKTIVIARGLSELPVPDLSCHPAFLLAIDRAVEKLVWKDEALLTLHISLIKECLWEDYGQLTSER